ncbi:MAG: hypothetical protein ACK2UE_04815 [Anaerolineales bacterium]
MSSYKNSFLMLLWIISYAGIYPRATISALSISDVSQSSPTVPLYEKLEINFDIEGSVAENPQWPYDPEDIPGLRTKTGITVDGLFLPPGKNNWTDAVVIPAFLYQPTEIDRSVTPESANSEWIYPVGDAYWVLRFSPDRKGTWHYKIRAQDDSNYPDWSESASRSFTATNAAEGVHGFVQVSTRDPRYFEYSDGTLFTGTGINAADAGIYHAEKRAEEEFQKYAAGDINFARTWMDMESIWSRGTHGWDGWKKSSGTADPLRSNEQVYEDHDFSIKLNRNDYNFIAQYSSGDQEMTGGLDAGKNYKVRITAYLDGVDPSELQVRLISDNSNFDSTIRTLAPSRAWTITDLGNGWKNFESNFVNDRGRFTFSWSEALAVGITSGGSAYIDEVKIGEDLGAGKMGPNVVFKGQMNYHLYFDPISSSNYDEIISLAERYGIHLKLVITDKEDEILNRIGLDDGIFDPSIPRQSPANFYSWKGDKVRRLHTYFWRYLAARWGYSRGVHSWELVNEGNPDFSQLYDIANHLAKTIDTLDHNHMATTSFWTSFPANSFWGNSSYDSMDYADVHAYISTGWIHDRSLEVDAAKYHIVYSEETRELLRAANQNMPIVRGEAGLDTLERQTEQAGLARDINGVWLHNYTWAMLHPAGMYELYWWSENIRTNPGPDGDASNGLFEIFAPYNDFMNDIPLNGGGYVDINSPPPAGMRVVGQKNNDGSAATRAHLWIQDLDHQWRTPDSGSLSGTFTLSEMKANTTFPIEWWDFNAEGILRKRTGVISSDSNGLIPLSLNDLPAINGSPVVDSAIKIGNYEGEHQAERSARALGAWWRRFRGRNFIVFE